MGVIKSLLFILLSIVVLYVSWLIIYWLTPKFMNLSWFWMIVCYVVFGGLLFPIIGFIPGVLSSIISNLKSHNIVEGIIVVLIALFFTFSACRLAWTMNAFYESKEIIFAILHNLFVVGLFYGVVLSLIRND